MIFRIPKICYIYLVDMNVKILFQTVLMFSSILFGVQNILDQNVNAFDNSGIRYIASLDPYQIVSDDRNYDRDSNGIAYLSIDPSYGEISYEVFLDGMSYVEGDDVEIIQIHLGIPGQNGPTVLSMCNEKSKEGHCREGPGLSVEGILEEKDLEGPLKGSSFRELIRLIESGESYVYVQSRAHPEGEIRGQIYY
jgi:hypothetical protein